MKRERTRSFCFVAFLVVPLLAMWAPDVAAQQRSETPQVGKYPGGHVGLRGGYSPPGGELGVFNFNRYYIAGNLKNASGDTIRPAGVSTYTNITGAEYVSEYKVFGMNWGGLIAVPFNTVNEHPNSPGSESSGMGLGDIVFAPFWFFGKSDHFDYQVGAGVWAPSGSFSPGSHDNHGSGFWEAIYSLGGVYYPDGNRKSFSISAVTRIEQNFTQRHTDVHVGDDVIMDWGISGPLLAFGDKFKHVFDIGVSGFATTQFTRETGANAALNTKLYRVFATGPEIRYTLPAWKMNLLFRPQWEYMARNTTQGMTYWVALVYNFGHI